MLTRDVTSLFSNMNGGCDYASFIHTPSRCPCCKAFHVMPSAPTCSYARWLCDSPLRHLQVDCRGVSSDRTLFLFPTAVTSKSVAGPDAVPERKRAGGLISDRRKFSTYTTMETGDFRIADGTGGCRLKDMMIGSIVFNQQLMKGNGVCKTLALGGLASAWVRFT